ncbi:flavodoxin family protein [Alkaliphilus hydrothermalis]|uniref:Multimeric flavodoxin WrbA n=1 Tax=Alkaliphilus hydrothermalis TaxID=1482730 RepID=A0ABS2NLM3_9FIRM|nr:NAD(P)H-dependent oxidoreductase [Alkaliphilus hydrothermalis]MBM7613845.1 multimeric flavodoxin WrbA [Alkaliphilus hydrothermalis]
MNKILFISTSMNKESKSKKFIRTFLSKLPDNKNTYLLDLSEAEKLNIFCSGYNNCKDTGICINPENKKNIDLVVQSDVIILGIPIYYGGLSGIGKLFIETFYCLERGELNGKKVIVILSLEKRNQEGIAVQELLPWIYKHGMKLIDIININAETELDIEIEKFKNTLEKINDWKLSESHIEFGKLNYLDRIVEIPISYNIEIEIK